LKSGYKKIETAREQDDDAERDKGKKNATQIHIEKVETKDFNRTFERTVLSAHARSGTGGSERDSRKYEAPEKVKFKQFNEMFDKCNARRSPER
jgi:hypothetical protein